MIETIFNDTIYTIDSDCMISKSKCEEYSKVYNNVSRSNAGGYHSTNMIGQLQLLENFLLIHAKTYAQQLGLRNNLTISELWLNINSYKAYNKSHAHPHSCLSGVYYVTTPTDCGRICFVRESSKLIDSYLLNYKEKETVYNWNEFCIPVRSGLLLLFPSYMEHYVEPNENETEPRISFSFNLS